MPGGGRLDLAHQWYRIGGAILLSASAGRAQAQALSALDLSPQLIVTHDSNIARSSEALAEERGLEREDILYSPAIELNIEAPLSRQTLFLRGSVGYDFHQRNTQLDRERIDIQSGAKYRLSRCSGQFAAGYGRRQSNVADLLDEGDIRNTEQVHNLSFDAKCGGPIGLAPYVALERSRGENSDADREASDVTSTTARAGVAYLRPSFGELRLIAERRTVRYPNRNILDDGGAITDGFDSSSGGLAFERSVGSRLRASASVNYTHVKPRDESARKFTGLTYQASVDMVLTSALKAQLTLVHDVQPSSVLEVDYKIGRVYGARADYALSERLSFAAGASLDKKKYRGAVSADLAGLASEQRRIAYALMNYQRSDRGSFSVEVSHERRNASDEAFDYSSTQVTLSARMSFG